MYTKQSTEMNQSRNTNPFQRNHNRRSNGSRGNSYHDWKNKTSEPAPKQKVLVPEDFPSLAAAPVKEKAKTVWQTAETSLAETVKDHLENDTLPVKKTVKMVEDFYAIPLDPKKEKRILYKEYVEEEQPPMIPLSAIYHRRNLRLKHLECIKKREMEEEEAAYRWQMSKRMIPPQPEPPMKHYDNVDEEEEEEELVEEAQEERSRRQFY